MAREYKELRLIGLHYHEVQGTMKDGKVEKKEFSYVKIKSPESLAALFKADALTDDEVQGVYECYVYGMDLHARAANKESVAPETTIVKVKGKEIDLLSFPLDRFIPAYNAKVAAITAEQALNPDAKLPIAFATTAKKHCESGAAILQDGKLYPAPAKPATKK